VFRKVSTKKIKVSSSEAGERLDVFVAKVPEITSRSQAEKLIGLKRVLVGGEVKPKRYKVKAGDVIEVIFVEEDKILPEPLPLKVLYKDKFLAVVSKPAGMVTHADKNHRSGTLVNALLYHLKKLSSIGAPERPGIVHRLDKDTSGLIVVAREEATHLSLIEMLKKKEVKREYISLVEGEISEDEGEILAPVGRSYRDRKKMDVNLISGREAVTRFQVIKRYPGFSLLKLTLLTGRTHQIRIHLKFMGYPVVGDQVYGGRKSGKKLGLQRQFLHAQKLTFSHPKTGELLHFEDEIPSDLKKVLKKLDEGLVNKNRSPGLL
jgi:23S rRNA pseudouridine1911/1915/1917 synthase